MEEILNRYRSKTLLSISAPAWRSLLTDVSLPELCSSLQTEYDRERSTAGQAYCTQILDRLLTLAPSVATEPVFVKLAAKSLYDRVQRPETARAKIGAARSLNATLGRNSEGDLSSLRQDGQHHT